MGRNSAISRSKSGAAIEGDDSDVVDGSDSGSDEDYGGGFSQSSISRRRKCVPKRSSGDDCDVGGDVPGILDPFQQELSIVNVFLA